MVKKVDLINEIISKVHVEKVVFLNDYATGQGKGYDYNLVLSNGIELAGRACAVNWHLPGHLRPELSGSHYKARNKVDYRGGIEFSLKNRGFKNYLTSLLKTELIELVGKL